MDKVTTFELLTGHRGDSSTNDIRLRATGDAHKENHTRIFFWNLIQSFLNQHFLHNINITNVIQRRKARTTISVQLKGLQDSIRYGQYLEKRLIQGQQRLCLSA